MNERIVEGKRKLVFVVSSGEVNEIVIPIDRLLPIDYKRLSKLNAEGGNLMRVMRDTTLENGKNALALYEHLLVVIPKDEPKKRVAPSMIQEGVQNHDDDDQPSKKKRGRPKGSGKKKVS